MKNTSIDDMILKQHSYTILGCKEEITGIRVIAKTGSYEQTDSRINDTKNTNYDEMIELSKINPKLFFEKLILSEFNDDYITSMSSGIEFVLPSKFQFPYKKCISFVSSKYQVYFTDLAIKYFSDLITKLELRRINDSLKYGSDMINAGKVNNLKISLSDGFSFERTSNFSFTSNKNKIYPNLLDYKIDKDINGSYNPNDLDNIEKLIDQFVTKNNGVEIISFTDNNLMALTSLSFYGSEGIIIENYRKNPKLLNKIYSLYK